MVTNPFNDPHISQSIDQIVSQKPVHKRCGGKWHKLSFHSNWEFWSRSSYHGKHLLRAMLRPSLIPSTANTLVILASIVCSRSISCPWQKCTKPPKTLTKSLGFVRRFSALGLLPRAAKLKGILCETLVQLSNAN